MRVGRRIEAEPGCVKTAPTHKARSPFRADIPILGDATDPVVQPLENRVCS